MVDLPVLQGEPQGCAPGPLTRRAKPDWLRVRAPGGERYTFIKKTLRERGLFTVCEEARCPNVGECWAGGTATFMLLGQICTRGCRFCAVTTGNPAGRVDAQEPSKLAESVALLELSYVVLTMVDRDDLDDGGAAHVAACIEHLKQRQPKLIIEALVGDFNGHGDAVDTLCDTGLEVFAHNLETVEAMQRTVRDARCGYAKSLAVLERAKRHPLRPLTKSSLMLGLGESDAQLRRSMQDLRSVGVDFLTLGQYLQPTSKHLDVVEWVPPERFAQLREFGERLGFAYVASGPLVRSSYRAGEFFVASLVEARRSGGPLAVGARSVERASTGEGTWASC
jgi:lipoic acid synthetase